MRRRAAIGLASVALSLLAIGGVASCKQGEGERCQVQADCEEGLQCNEGEGVCRSVSTGDIDALLPIDAPADAAIDAAIDSM